MQEFDLVREVIMMTEYFSLAVAKLHRALVKTLDIQLAAFGVTIGQFYVLRSLLCEEPATCASIGKKLEMDRTTVTRGLDYLLKNKLVVVNVGADIRRREITLTTEGKALAELTSKMVEDFDTRLGILWDNATHAPKSILKLTQAGQIINGANRFLEQLRLIKVNTGV